MISLKARRPGQWFWRRIRLPQRFSEMNRKQALAFSAMLMIRQVHFNQEFTVEDKLFFLGVLCANVSQQDYYNLGELAIEELYQAVDGIYDDDHAHPVLRYILVNGRKYRLPNYGMEKCTFFQWVVAEDYYDNICQNQGNLKENLIGLAAVLCQPRLFKKSYARTIEEMKKNQAEIHSNVKRKRYMALWQSTTDVELYGVLYWYRHTRSVVRKEFSHLFSETIPKKGVDFTSQFRWAGVSNELAGGPFGTAEELDGTNMYRVLHYVNYNSAKFKEHEINSAL